MNRKDRRAAGKAGAKPSGLGSPAEPMFALGIRSHQAGQLAQAEQHYRDALTIDPSHSNSLYCLGVLALQTGRNNLAIDTIGKAIKFNDREPDWHYHLGAAYQGAGRFAEAEIHHRQAIVLRPSYADAHHSLGVIAAQAGRTHEAIKHYRNAIASEPKHVAAKNNLGNLIASAGQLDEAAEIFRQIVEIQPDFLQAQENLARTKLYLGQPAQAVSVLLGAFQRGSSPAMKDLFFRAVKDVQVSADDANIRALLLRAMSEPWGRPVELIAVAVSLIKTNPAIAGCIERAASGGQRRWLVEDLFCAQGLAAVTQDRLLTCLLETAPAADVELERFLTAARQALLTAVAPSERANDEALMLLSMLAKQCFINEYVFAVEPDELAQAHRLRDAVVERLDSATSIPASWLMAVAAYMPLHAIPAADRLLDRAWPDPVAAVLTHQVREPKEELGHSVSISSLTPIEDGVSRLVQEQYEENPYPRWVKTPAAPARGSLENHLQNLLPMASFRSLGKGEAIDILIAGCGTGLQVIETAQNFPRAKIVAVDLSRSSLAYAMRKSREARIVNVEFAHADILSLRSIGRTFDLIVSTGVLHHMSDPFEGWRVLVALLGTSGVMNIGLYSELARREVVEARNAIAKRGYCPTAVDIRRFRQDIIRMPAASPLKALVRSGDFFATSGCRDLLFHVQEHRHSLPQIEDFLAEQKLRFLGFNLPDVILGRYAACFPDDKAMTSLKSWHLFETENPHIFKGMYQFWVQRES